MFDSLSGDIIFFRWNSKAKRRVKFHHLTRDASLIRRKVGNGNFLMGNEINVLKLKLGFQIPSAYSVYLKKHKLSCHNEKKTTQANNRTWTCFVPTKSMIVEHLHSYSTTPAPDASHIYKETYSDETSVSRSVSTRLDSSVHSYTLMFHGDGFQTSDSITNCIIIILASRTASAV